ncbi:hypothetical protein Forpi1262_v013935 [Fusarium oxysporum f. sp. raphani]|uniref:Uncharacterized protein n=1 Tax=Fusarium oxysporum f. sp. raphani TaxID=96318 RepID=A0A8J5PJC0_FUSOX|nr:hypothetical protein Forpi1262_v013935 [Fusarium oxysporum f. sp. raphani]
MPTDIATRALVVTLKAPCGGAKTSREIETITGIPRRTVDSIYARAIRNGFEPNERPLRIINAWLEDRPRSGRPSKCTAENQELIIAKLSGNRDLEDDGEEDPQGSRIQENEANEEA